MIRSENCGFFSASEYLKETPIGDLFLLFRKIKSPTRFFHSLLFIPSLFKRKKLSGSGERLMFFNILQYS
jgi:hypothetical protein